MKSGFTLIELLIAISIISILATIGFISYAAIQRDARDSRRLSDLRLIEQSLEHLRSKNGQYPIGNNTEPKNIPELLAVMTQFPSDPHADKVYKYSALPAGCDGTTTGCTDYLLCGYQEGTKATNNPTGCGSLSCSITGSGSPCKIGLTAQ